MPGRAAILLFSCVSALDITPHRPSANSWKRTQCGGPSGTADTPSKWAYEVTPNSPPLPEYPRPMLLRGRTTDRDTGDASTWRTLNGLWEWQPGALTPPPFNQTLASSILVPFPVESCLSGVAPTSSAGYVDAMWYRLLVDVAPPAAGARTLLHFEAVDWQATVYANGELVANHTGGFDGFTADVSGAVARAANGPLELLVHVFDPADRGAQPNGKQRISAIDNPGGDTYTPASGIWQTVWLEAVPATYVSRVVVGADATTLRAKAIVDNCPEEEGTVRFEILDVDGTMLASADADVDSGEASTSIAVPSPRLWSPSSPRLYDLRVTVSTGLGPTDTVLAYFGMRTFQLANVTAPPVPMSGPRAGVDIHGGDLPNMPIELPTADPKLCWAKCNATKECAAWAYAVPGCDRWTKPQCWLKGDSHHGDTKNTCRVSGTQGMPSGRVAKPVLNGEFVFLAGWLDQSFWPDGIYTAPTDDALAYDLEAVRTFGMNMVRLHQKVNSERWYWHADRMGVVVMQDAVQKYGHANASTIPFFEHDLVAMIEGRGNHPCIVQWETFNEGDCWAVFDAAGPPHSVNDTVALARRTDWQGRLVDTDSGGGANDQPEGDVNDIHSYPDPGDPTPKGNKYAMIGEFGGIGAFVAGKEWVPGKCHTYEKVDTPQDEADTYVKMAAKILSQIGHLSASVYTQITDVELECDGFLNYDRSTKFTPAQTAAIRDANLKLVEASRRFEVRAAA